MQQDEHYESVASVFRRCESACGRAVSAGDIAELLRTLDAEFWSETCLENLVSMIKGQNFDTVGSDEILRWVFQDESLCIPSLRQKAKDALLDGMTAVDGERGEAEAVRVKAYKSLRHQAKLSNVAVHESAPTSAYAEKASEEHVFADSAKSKALAALQPALAENEKLDDRPCSHAANYKPVGRRSSAPGGVSYMERKAAEDEDIERARQVTRIALSRALHEGHLQDKLLQLQAVRN